jgi:hypothetical protein
VLLMPADCALVFIRPREISSAIERLRALDLASQGWRDKIVIVWVLEEGALTTLGLRSNETLGGSCSGLS